MDGADLFEHEGRAVYGGRCSFPEGRFDMHRSTEPRIYVGGANLIAGPRIHECGWCGCLFAATHVPDDTAPALRVVGTEPDNER